MREIKFRAWIPEKCEMLYASLNDILRQIGNGNCNFVGDDERFGEAKSGNVELFTGLRDKNGKEIYEGDVVSVVCNHNRNGWSGEVQFSGGKFGIYSDFEWEDLDNVESIKVIGNIHETKHAKAEE